MKYKVFQLLTILVSSVTAVLIGAAFAHADPASDLEECRNISVESERLACFDAAYDQLKASGMTPDSVLRSNVVEVKVPGGSPAEGETKSDKTEKGRFFGLPVFRKKVSENPETFGLGKKEYDRDADGTVSGISNKIAKVQRDATGQVVVTLESGQVWKQTDGGRIRAQVGDFVSINQTRVGGYFMKINESRAVRARRIDDGSQAGKAAEKEADQLIEDLEPAKEKKRGFLSRIGRRFGLGDDDKGAAKGSDENLSFENNLVGSRIVSSVMLDATGNFVATLDDGNVWQQTSGTLNIRTGDVVVLEQAGAGKFQLRQAISGESVDVEQVK